MKAKIFTIIVATLVLTVFAGDFGGIGLVIMDRKRDGEPLRTGFVYPGSPAERAGIKPNGFLISVDGTNVVSMSLSQSVSFVRGPVGTAVTLELADSSMSHTNKFTVTRKRVVFSDQGAEAEFFDH
jgi:carboxyl-terminal processing protease